jgi:hypothetical protein
VKTKWPWITLVLALVLALFPPVNDIIHSAFFSGEQLARSIAQLVLMEFVGVVLVFALIEWGIRWYAAHRRAAALQIAGQTSPPKES